MAERPDYLLERALGAPGVAVAGIDEAGRGAWAGPVVAAAVMLDGEDVPEGVRDSKQLSRAARESLFARIQARGDWAVGIVEREEIDRRNILRASLQAMQLAAQQLTARVEGWLVDGRQVPENLGGAARAVVGGDRKSLSIAAASIVAKVTRDRIMAQLAGRFPGYGWERNMGYGTAEHRRGLERLGVTRQHRLSFRPMRQMLQGLAQDADG